MEKLQKLNKLGLYSSYYSGCINNNYNDLDANNEYNKNIIDYILKPFEYIVQIIDDIYDYGLDLDEKEKLEKINSIKNNKTRMNEYYYTAYKNKNIFPINKIIEKKQNITEDLYLYKYKKYKQKYINFKFQ